MLHITSDNLPQWLPTIVDCGLGASLGIQNIPLAARNKVGDVIREVIASIFGGTQVIVRGDEVELLQRNEPSSSPRRRRPDIETGSMTRVEN